MWPTTGGMSSYKAKQVTTFHTSTAVLALLNGFFHLVCAMCSGRTVQNKVLFRKFLLFRLRPSSVVENHVQFSHKHNIAHLQLNKNS